LQLRVVGLQVNDKQEVARLRDSAWKAAVGSLKDPTPALRESLDVLVSGVSVSGTEALPRALGVVEALVSNLEGNLGKFERDVGENVGSVQVEVKALRDEVSWLSVDVKTILVALDEALKPKGGIGNFLKRL
jgi:hypothetical protein